MAQVEDHRTVAQPVENPVDRRIEIGDRTIHYTATAGKMVMKTDDGELLQASGRCAEALEKPDEAIHLYERAIEKDPTRDNGLRVLMGPFSVYDETNVEGGTADWGTGGKQRKEAAE